MTLSRDLAWAAATDAGNRSMRAAARSVWSEEDFNDTVREFNGPNGKIAAIDTEHGSLSKYADLVEFDVLELDSFTPQNFLNSLHAAENAGYAVFCADSLSHFWVGKDGALEFVDMAAKRNNDNFGGWKTFRPYEREMVDAILASPCHV